MKAAQIGKQIRQSVERTLQEFSTSKRKKLPHTRTSLAKNSHKEQRRWVAESMNLKRTFKNLVLSKMLTYKKLRKRWRRRKASLLVRSKTLVTLLQ